MKPIIIGVGGTGSGKTAVSEAILERGGRERIIYIQHDSCYADIIITEGRSTSRLSIS